MVYYDPACLKSKIIIAVVDEVVRDYDIDAIHFDYFYPYKIPGENFNDTASFKKWWRE
jgi:uncharacterized lipoprotein YddW (UPF0748 family)